MWMEIGFRPSNRSLRCEVPTRATDQSAIANSLVLPHIPAACMRVTTCDDRCAAACPKTARRQIGPADGKAAVSGQTREWVDQGACSITIRARRVGNREKLSAAVLEDQSLVQPTNFSACHRWLSVENIKSHNTSQPCEVCKWCLLARPLAGIKVGLVPATWICHVSPWAVLAAAAATTMLVRGSLAS